jgi:TetR/AcrR family transcriptional regulator, regulator of cefoperazone and chloramphenicol sensitivity
VQTPTATKSTREKIIHAAGELFAAHGFAGVTARQVSTSAGVALSAIPYHFGTMEALYREVLATACTVDPVALPLAQTALDASPQEGLRIAVAWAVRDLDALSDAWPLRLIAREEFEPSSAFRDTILEKHVPEWNWLCEVVGRAAGVPPDSQAVQFGVIVMYTMTVALTHRTGLVAELAPETLKSIHDREAYIELMARLTLDAVQRFRESMPTAVSGHKMNSVKGQA